MPDGPLLIIEHDRAYVHLSVPKCIKDLRVMITPETKLPAIQVSCGENHSAALLVEAVETLTKEQVTSD